MSNVVEFAPRHEKTDPHATGEAFCLACDHVWVAVVPVGETLFECPSCRSMQGRFRYEVVPSCDVWECQCGNQLFYITPDGHWCPRCGILQQY